MSRFFIAVPFVLATLGNTVSAQAPNEFNDPNNPPAVLQGSETHPGLGPLVFLIRGNSIQMTDASGRPVKGTGSVVGDNRLVFTFLDCVYEGDLIDGICSGTARYTSGSSVGMTWTFRVHHVAYPPQKR